MPYHAILTMQEVDGESVRTSQYPGVRVNTGVDECHIKHKKTLLCCTYLIGRKPEESIINLKGEPLLTPRGNTGIVMDMAKSMAPRGRYNPIQSAGEKC